MVMMDFNSLHDKFFDRSDGQDDPDLWSSHSPDSGVVTAAHYLASAAGAEMLRKGGNAIDAAIATSFALGVCEPAGSGLGGMALMVVHWADQNRLFTIEGPCLAPRRATAEAVAANSNRYRGHAAIAVPTHVATMNYAHKRYATLPVHQLLEPAIALAEQGFPVTATLSGLMKEYGPALRKRSAGQIFLDQRKPYAVGDRLRQPALANTLTTLASRGLEDFYEGQIGRAITDDIQAGGGYVDREDFEPPPQPRERTPIRGNLGDDIVYTMGPPGGGMTLVQLSQLFTALNRPSLDFDCADDVVLLARMIRRARQERKRFRLKHLADAPGQAEMLLDLEYNRGLLKHILPPPGSGETTHVSIMDRWGNAVALTQSIERSFGSCVVTPDLGFCYNGYLRAFKVVNRRHPYYLQPGLPARSNASPTIVTRGGRPWALLGSTGSERMISGIFCCLMRLRSMDAFQAVHGARLHCTPEGIVILEAERFTARVRQALVSAGFRLDIAEPYAFRVGGLQLVLSDESGVTGVADPRRDGAAICG